MPPEFSSEIKEKLIFPDRPVDQPRTSPCEANCPAGNPIQKASSLIQQNRIEEALEYLRSRNPFPGITGRVCMHSCEQSCNRNRYDEGLSIRALERFAADHADLIHVVRPQKRKDSGRRLAIIGSGPAGMTCAYFSSLLGHDVTVFESSSSLGGIPRLGIPDFRLPKEVVDREVRQVLEAGVKARTNVTVGKDLPFEKIQEDFDACLIAIGTWKEKRVPLPGAEFALPALSFLRQVNEGLRNSIGDRVVIVGGGGVAFDCAFTARRLGASDVHVICVEGKSNMCATPEDVLQAEAEGVTIHNSWMVSKVLNDGKKPIGIQFFQIASFRFDERGSLLVQPLSCEEKTISADTIISAVGLQPDFQFIERNGRFRFTLKGTLEVDPRTFATPIEGVFAAGDAVLGPSTVAQAIGSGRKSAIAIDRYLLGCRSEKPGRVMITPGGDLVTEEASDQPDPHVVEFEEILNVDHFERRPRLTAHKLPAGISVQSFEEIEKTIRKDGALAEVERCFHCGHCTLCENCVKDCPGLILVMGPQGPQVAYFDECWHCGCCRIACPSGAILYQFPLNMLV